MCTFGDIWVHGEIIIGVRILIKKGDVVGFDEILNVSDEERLVFLDVLEFILFDILLRQVEDLSREQEPLLVGLVQILLG